MNFEWSLSRAGGEYVKNAIDSEYWCAFVAKDGQQVVGYLIGHMKEPDGIRKLREAEFDTAYVEEEYRGQGIGKKLEAEAIAWCKDEGIQKISVSIYADNLNSVGFHESMGFKPYVVEMELDI